ncbi:MAG: hypothetical protein HY742_06515 [Deltaproteobacteria bacterium]|nr:hypothetical protein [Deltaproteobacteria bacterium]
MKNMKTPCREAPLGERGTSQERAFFPASIGKSPLKCQGKRRPNFPSLNIILTGSACFCCEKPGSLLRESCLGAAWVEEEVLAAITLCREDVPSV